MHEPPVRLGTTLSCGGSSCSLHWAPPTLPNWSYQQSHRKQMAQSHRLSSGISCVTSRCWWHREPHPAWQTADAFSLSNHYQGHFKCLLKWLFTMQRRKPSNREAADGSLPHHRQTGQQLPLWQGPYKHRAASRCPSHPQPVTEWVHLSFQ